jgi:hypothetical protein
VVKDEGVLVNINTPEEYAKHTGAAKKDTSA